jgi:peptidoglycan/LPS O-acetylase OafA/YrhL
MGAPSVKQGGGRFIAGDPLRGVACLVVLFWHTVVNSAVYTPPDGVSPYYSHELSFLGRPIFTLSVSVWLFFALSGYLIAGPFVRALVRGDGRRPKALPYARNRILRVVPGFWAILTLTLILEGTRGDSLKHIAEFYGFVHVWDQGSFTPAMVQAWTLDVEAVFYIMTPLLLLPLATLLRGRGTPWQRASIILAGCVVLGAASLALGQRWPHTDKIVPGSAWAFGPGIALATVEPLLRDKFAGRHFGRWVARGLLALAAAAFLLQSYVVTFYSNAAQNLCAVVSCGALLAAPLVLQWTTGSTWKLFDNRFLHWVGVRAFGVYLIHVQALHFLRPVTEWAGSVPMALLTTFPLTVLISVPLGALSFRYVEKPFLERGVPWRTSSVPAETAAVAPAAAGPEPVAAPAGSRS